MKSVSYRYYAFISFQNADAAQALWLQKAIENYRIPSVLRRKDADLPRRIRPCFCYLNDIHAREELMTELKERMEQSRYLIVVCSKNSAQSTFVNSGIDYFISLGRRDKIIPVIIDGIPYSGDTQTECFPEALRRNFPKHTDPLLDHQILGINLNESGVGNSRARRKRALLMIVARMLNIEFDGLALRDKQRNTRLRVLGTAIVGIVIAAMAAIWIEAQTVDIEETLTEQTVQNDNLPPLENAVLTLQLGNEQKTDTLKTIDSKVILRHIPPQYIGKPTKLQLRAKDYLPLDTTLQKKLQLPIRRDESIYGNVRFRLFGVAHPEREPLQIAGETVYADKDGLVRLFVPLSRQQSTYRISTRLQLGQDSVLYMPCGTDVVIVAE